MNYLEKRIAELENENKQHLKREEERRVSEELVKMMCEDKDPDDLIVLSKEEIRGATKKGWLW